MSYWNQFHASARHSEAIAILNHVRHYLTGRKPAPPSGAQQSICRKAVALEGFAAGTDDSFIEVDALSAAFELSNALHGAATSLHYDEEQRRNTLAGFEALLDGVRPDSGEAHRNLMHLVERSMDSISGMPAEGQVRQLVAI